jgi:hypothetical protein
VEVAEGNVHGDEDNIGWVAEEVAPKFDSLAKHKGPCCQCNQKRLPLFGRPLLSRLVPRVEDEEIVGECPRGDGSLEDRVCAPWLGPVLKLTTVRFST